MDLLRLVLVRLPMAKIAELVTYEGFPFSDDELIRLRNRYVNRFSEAGLETYLRELSKKSSLRITKYYRLCELQGELLHSPMPGMSDYFQFSRAAFLRDRQTYDRLCRNKKVRSPDIVSALISDVPEIQAWAIVLNVSTFDIPDPEVIHWTPKLMRFYQSRLTEYLKNGPTNMDSNLHVKAYLAGYLHCDIEWWNNPMIKPNYCHGYLRSEMLVRRAEDPERMLSRFPDHSILTIGLESGYSLLAYSRRISEIMLVVFWPLSDRLSWI